jgi:hypothetical protein
LDEILEHAFFKDKFTPISLPESALYQAPDWNNIMLQNAASNKYIISRSLYSPTKSKNEEEKNVHGKRITEKVKGLFCRSIHPC